MSFELKGSKFNSQIKSGLKLLRLFGLAPISVDTYRANVWIILVTIIPTVVCMVNAFYEALYQTLLYDMPTTMILLNKLHSAVNATSVIFFALNAAAQMKKFARVNQLMNHIDLVLADEKKFLKPFLPSSALNRPKSLIKRLNLTPYMVHIFLLLGIFHFAFDYYIVLQYFIPGLKNWIMEIITLITILVQRGFVVQLFMTIENKYKKMNRYLLWHKYSYSKPVDIGGAEGGVHDSMYKTTDQKPSEESVMSTQDMETHQRTAKPLKSKIFVNEKLIKSFILIHYELKHVCNIISKIVGTVLCLLIVFNVVRMMLFYYVLSFVIVSMINDTPVRHKYRTFSCFIVWTFRLYSEVYILARYCHNIAHEANTTSKILNKIQHSKSSIFLAHFFRRSKIMLRRQKVEWSGLIFTLDMPFFFSVGSKVFTYCFILVQFQRQFEMDKFPI